MNVLNCVTDCVGGAGGAATLLVLVAPTIINGLLKSHHLPGWAGAVVDALSLATRNDAGGTWKLPGKRSVPSPAAPAAPASTDTPAEKPPATE